MKTNLSLIVSVLACSLPNPGRVAFCQDWIWTTNRPGGDLASIVSSADGNKLVETAFLGGVFSSTNGGQTWIWYSNGVTGFSPPITSSADGKKLAAANHTTGGAIYTSTNGGSTWASNFVFGSSGWASIASSSDGNQLVAAPNGAGTIFISTNAGLTWKSNNLSSVQAWGCVASSADGSKLVAGTYQNVYTSTNSGDNWMSYYTPNLGWRTLASSADGMKLVAGVNFGNFGSVYTSTNGGATWASNSVPVSSAKYQVVSSADGKSLIASGTHGTYSSANGGATWTSNYVEFNTGFHSVASSADGNKLVAVGSAGFIYTSETMSTPLLGIKLSASNVVISWLIPSQPFTLQQNPDLTTTNWSDVPTPPVLNLTNLHHEVTMPLSSSSIFYRLKGNP